MQPQIDFYILPDASALKSHHFACGLIKQAYDENQSVYVNASSREEADRLDSLLWTFEEDSFIPHQVGIGSDPVLIGYNTDPGPERQILINFAPQVPTFFKRFKKVIEIVFSDPVVQQLARERYKYYRDEGFTINTHKKS